MISTEEILTKLSENNQWVYLYIYKWLTFGVNKNGCQSWSTFAYTKMGNVLWITDIIGNVYVEVGESPSSPVRTLSININQKVVAILI